MVGRAPSLRTERSNPLSTSARMMDCVASLAMTFEGACATSKTTSRRQIPPDRGQKENRDVDREPDAPENRAQRRAIAEIGEDIGDPHDQEEHCELVDQVLRPETEFRQQDGDRKERKRLDAVLVGAERAGTDRVVVEG